MWHFIKHFRVVMKHKYYVFKLCCKVGIPVQGILHDMSKFSPTEFIPSARFYQGDRSPTEGERRAYGYSKAWMHHKGRNKHHFEYWTDYSLKTHKAEPVKMPMRYLKEMFCDRVAAGKAYLGKKYTNANPLNYYLMGNARSVMHPESAKQLQEWLELLNTGTENDVCKYIKSFPNKESRFRG